MLDNAGRLFANRFASITLKTHLKKYEVINRDARHRSKIKRKSTIIKMVQSYFYRACPGVEPGTSRTESENHVTRLTGYHSTSLFYIWVKNR